MNSKEEKERKRKKVEAIVDKIIATIAGIVVLGVIVMFIGPAMYAGAVMTFTKPSTYILPITEKDLEDAVTRSGVMSAPYLYFVLDTGEEVKIKVNSDSYENVQVGDMIAIDVWEIFEGNSVAQLNAEYNNTVREED